MDYWSLGVIAFVFFAGRYPFNKGHGQISNDRSDADRMIMYKRIIDGLIEYPDNIPAMAADVISQACFSARVSCAHLIVAAAPARPSAPPLQL